MMSKPLQKNGVPHGRRLIESDAFPIEFVSRLAEMESWRKEVHRPIYHIHKWWAKRLGSVFRAILLGSALPESESLEKVFYRKHNFNNLMVFDPFMGSGTTIGEAHKLGFTTFGRDINPVACESVRVALGPLDKDALLKAFAKLSAGVGEKICTLYQTTDDQGQVCDALYYFWVKTLPCPACSERVDLYSSYIFARNAYPDRKPEVRVYCPGCGGIFAADVKDTKIDCPHCDLAFNPQAGPASGASATCRHCHHKFAIAKTTKALGHPPEHRLFAKLVLNNSDEKIYLPITGADESAYRRCAEELAQSKVTLPNLELADGYNTRQVLNYAYRSWREFFNDRQLLALGWLHQAILELPDDAVRAAMLTTFSGALEFNNMFASYKGEGTGAIRHMFAHHILKPERVPIEGNVWGTSRSSGSFSTLFRSRLLRAIEYRAAPFETTVERNNGRNDGRRIYEASAPFTGNVSTQWPPTKTHDRGIYLSCGSSASTGLPTGSLDLVVTDPPFFDNVHYSELADFFYAWQQLEPSPFTQKHSTTRHPEEVQDVSAEQFEAKLRAVFQECCRTLKDDGLLIFTYHHSRMDGWTALTNAVMGSGLAFVNCHPVKAEMSVAAPKAQAKEPIQLDMVMVCRKQANDGRKQTDDAVLFQRAVELATMKAKRLADGGLVLSFNDRRIILIGQYLVEACVGRSAEHLADALSARLTDLDFTATQLLESHSVEPMRREDKQLALFEKSRNKQVSEIAKQTAIPANYRQHQKRRPIRTG